MGTTRGCSSVGRAIALHAIGRRFDSYQLHHKGEKELEISKVNGIAQTSVNKYTIEKVYKTGDGKHKVEQPIYYVTTYDSNGFLQTTTNSHKINYLI